MARKTRQAFPIAPEANAPADDTPKTGPRRAPMFAKGAASLDNARKSAAAEERMYRNLSVSLIDPSPIRDRIDLSEDLDALKRSLAEEGQQIPILVRPKPGTDRYEIVAGRRRLQATKELGRDVIQAFVRSMDDEEAFVAQGVENNARLETSFIERARTILSALEAGFSQVQVEKFLGVDQTMISRMKTIFTGIGEEVVLAIGPARGVGRRKWERLQKLVAASGEDREALAAKVPEGEDSVERFDAFLARMEAFAPPAPAAAKVAVAAKPLPAAREIAGGRLVAKVSGRRMVLETDKKLPPGFFEYLEEQLPQILESFAQKSGKLD